MHTVYVYSSVSEHLFIVLFQNWQTLFGVYCHAPPSSSPALSLTEPTFKICSISSGPHGFLVGGPIWEAGSISSGLLMGRVVVGVVAQVASINRGSSEKCELRLNLGYKQFLYLPMFVKGRWIVRVFIVVYMYCICDIVL